MGKKSSAHEENGSNTVQVIVMESTASPVADIGSNQSDGSNLESSNNSYDLDFSTTLQEFLKKSGKPDWSKAKLLEKSIVYEDRWKVTVYWSQTLKYPKGTLLVEFKLLKYSQPSQSYLFHELLNDNKLFLEAFNTLCVFGGYLTREIFEALVICATKLEQMEKVVLTTPVVFNSLFGGALREIAKSMSNKSQMHTTLSIRKRLFYNHLCLAPFSLGSS